MKKAFNVPHMDLDLAASTLNGLMDLVKQEDADYFDSTPVYCDGEFIGKLHGHRFEPKMFEPV